MSTFFWGTGVLFWVVVVTLVALGVLSALLTRPRVRRWLEQPARYPYAYLVGYRVAGYALAVYRKLGGPRAPPGEVDYALRSVTLSHMKALRDALLDVDRLPCVEKGKAALGLPSVFEIPTRGVSRVPSPYTHPLQYPPYYLPGVPARMFYDPSEFEWVRPLEQAFPAIRAELLRVLEEDGAGFQAYMNEGNRRLAGWNTFNFFFYGRKFEENCARCPETTRVLESLPRFERDHVMFSALNPHSHIPPHTGPMNGIIRGHLALVAPPGLLHSRGQRAAGVGGGQGARLRRLVRARGLEPRRPGKDRPVHELLAPVLLAGGDRGAREIPHRVRDEPALQGPRGEPGAEARARPGPRPVAAPHRRDPAAPGKRNVPGVTSATIAGVLGAMGALHYKPQA